MLFHTTYRSSQPGSGKSKASLTAEPASRVETARNLVTLQPGALSREPASLDPGHPPSSAPSPTRASQGFCAGRVTSIRDVSTCFV